MTYAVSFQKEVLIQLHDTILADMLCMNVSFIVTEILVRRKILVRPDQNFHRFCARKKSVCIVRIYLAV